MYYNDDDNNDLDDELNEEETVGDGGGDNSSQPTSQQLAQNNGGGITKSLANSGARAVSNKASNAMKQSAQKAGNAAKNAAKKAAKEATKNIAKSAIKGIAIKGIAIALAIILGGAAAFAVIGGILDSVSEFVDSLGNSFTSTSSLTSSTMGQGINISDESIEQLVQKIQDMGVSLKDLYLCGDIDYSKDMNDPANITQRNKYLRQFLLASLVTQYPDFGIVEDETHYNGIIKVKRASSDASDQSASKDMEYVTVDVLQAMIDAIKKGSIDDKLNETYPVQRIDVKIDSTRNGARIPAIVFLPEGAQNVPLVLMCHGFTGKKEGDNDHFVTLGNTLAENGIAAITIDFASCGSSTDLSVNYTLDEMEKDMDAAVEFMRSTYSIDETKLGIVGHSMGGRIATEYLDKVQAAALWAPADGDGLSGLEFLGDYNSLYNEAKENGSVDSGWKNTGNAYNGQPFYLSREFFQDMELSHPLEKLSSFTNPILVAFGNNDNVIVEAQDDIVASMPAQGLYKTYDQDHNFTLGDTETQKNDEQQLLTDTANLFTQAFFGHDISETGTEVDNPLKDYTVEELRNKIFDVFSVDNEGNLYFATMNTVETTTLDDSGNPVTTPTYTPSLMKVNYKKTVEKYAFPIEVAVDLCVITQNPEYVYQFIEDYVLSGEIEITILDTKRIDSHESWFDWTVVRTITERAETGGTPTVTTYNDEVSKYQYNKVVRTTVSSIAAITNVDTWMAKSNINYTNTTGQVEYPLGTETVVKDEECPVKYNPQEVVTIPVEVGGKTVNYEYTTTRQVQSCTFTESQNIQFNEWQKGTVFVDSDEISKKADRIIKQWGDKFLIPNSSGSYASPANKLENGEAMFLEFLNKENTQKQYEIYKFLFERARDPNFSINNLDLSIYNDMELIVMTENDIIVDVTKSATELVLSKEEIQEAIMGAYSGDIETNLLGALDAFYEIQNTNKVNAIFAIAVTIQESSGGTNWNLIDSSTHNWMSLTGAGYTDKNGTNWKSYSSFSEATKDFGDLIANRGPYFRDGNYSVSTIGQHYCVPPEGWISGVISIMSKLYNTVGINLDTISQEGTSQGGGQTGFIGTESGAGYWGTFTSSAGKTYTLYYQNYISANNNWGIDSNQMCLATATAIVHSADGLGRDPTDFWGKGGAINIGLTGISRDSSVITQYLQNGNPVIVYSNFGSDFYGSPHALALLDVDSNGNVFVANPYYEPDGNGGQKKGGWYPLSTILSYTAASTNSFGSCGVLLS